jgi:hypothetical protein
MNKEDTPSRKSKNDSESDVLVPKSDGDKKFWKMHLKNKIADRNGNGDDVFNASNIKAEPPHLGKGGADIKTQTKLKGVSEATRRIMSKIKEDSQSAGSDNPSSSDSSPPTGNDQKIVDNSSAKAPKDPNGFKSVLEKIALQAAQLHDELDDDDMDDVDPDTQTKLNEVKSLLDDVYKSVSDSDNNKSMKNEEAEDLDEISKDLAARYSDKAIGKWGVGLSASTAKIDNHKWEKNALAKYGRIPGSGNRGGPDEMDLKSQLSATDDDIKKAHKTISKRAAGISRAHKILSKEEVVQSGNKYQTNLMHQVKLEAHPLTGLAKGESPMSDSQVRAHYAKHRPGSFVAKNPTAPLTNDHKRYAHIDRTFLSKVADNDAKNKARDDKFYGATNETYKDATRDDKIHKKVMSKAGNHIGTIWNRTDGPMLAGDNPKYFASYHPHGPVTRGGAGDNIPKSWTYHETAKQAEQRIHDHHAEYKSDADAALEKAKKHRDSIAESSTAKLKKYISKAEDDRESADNNDYRGSEYNDHDMDYVHDKSGDAKVQARGAKRDKYIKIAQARLDAKKTNK